MRARGELVKHLRKVTGGPWPAEDTVEEGLEVLGRDGEVLEGALSAGT
jgi:hypothetical protein